MKEKKYFKKFLSLTLAILMLINIIPNQSLAEVKKSDWKKEVEEKSDRWPLTEENELSIFRERTDIRVPSINFVGLHNKKDKDGNIVEVVRLKLSGSFIPPGRNSYSIFNKWKNFVVKVDDDLYDLIDWDNENTGMYIGYQQVSWSDNHQYEKVYKFTDISKEKVGVDKAKNIDILDGTSIQYTSDKHKNSKRGSRDSCISINVPFQFVLKKGKSIKNLQKAPLIQARIYDNEYKEVFSRISNVFQFTLRAERPYGSYTLTTTIPVNKNFKNNLTYSIEDWDMEKFILSADTYLRYNEKEGSVDIITRQAIPRISETFKIYKKKNKLAYQQSFEKKFMDVLKEKDGKIGFMGILDYDENFRYKDHLFDKNGNIKDWNNKFMIPITKNDINFKNNSNNLEENIAFIRVSTTDWAEKDTEKNIKTILTDSRQWDTLLGFNSNIPQGPGVIVRYFVDKEKFEKNIEKEILKRYDFSSYYLFPTEENTQNLIYEIPIKEDLELKRGQTVNFNFSDGKYRKFVDMSYTMLEIGEDQYSQIFRSSLDIDKDGRYKYRRLNSKAQEWIVPYDIFIKKGEKIKLHINFDIINRVRLRKGTNLQLTTVGLGSSDVKDLVPEKDSRYKIFMGSYNVTPTFAEYSCYLPKVDEVFTDSKAINGHSKYERARININIPYQDGETIKESLQYLGAAGGIWARAEKFKTKETLEDNTFLYKEYFGFKFNTEKVNPGYGEGYKKFVLPKLLKDTPISITNTDIMRASKTSNPVIEQVQAKVKFNLGDGKSRIEGIDLGKNFIEKIVPLNKNYLFIKDENNKYIKNPDYIANGFGTINKDRSISDKNLKISNKEVVDVKQSLMINGALKEIDRKVINYLDHYDEEYGINSNDAYTKKKSTEDLLKRQFPIADEIEVFGDQRLIGWTTKPLNSIENDKSLIKGKFHELEKKNNVIRTLEDWQKVDNSSEIYIVDENSPIDKDREVYAVYGNPSIIFHSGIKDKNGEEIIRILPITKKDIDNANYNDEYIDAFTSSTIKPEDKDKFREKYNKEGIIKEIPKAPYFDDNYYTTHWGVYRYDFNFKDFKKKNHTFVGWKAIDIDEIEKQDASKREEFIKNKLESFEAGEYNQRIEQLESRKVFRKVENYNRIRDEENAYLPNGYKLWLYASDFKIDGKPLKTRDEFFNKAKDVHLFAIYRPYYKVSVNPRYMEINRVMVDENHKYGRYTDTVKDSLKRPLQIGLLTRTAVTPYTDPTVAASANYNPIEDIIPDEEKTFRTYTPGSDKKLEWTVPGYDELGQRKSYVSIVVEEGKEGEYYRFGIDFNEEKWSKLGITTYYKFSGESLDLNAPKNLHETKENADKYGTALAKTQNITFNRWEYVDALTSATSRESLIRDGKRKELKGYNIIMTISPDPLPTPQIDRIREKDKKITLGWPSRDYVLKDYEDINKIKVEISGTKNNSSGGLSPYTIEEWELEKKSDTLYSFTKDGFTITGKVEDDKLIISENGNKLDFTKYSHAQVDIHYIKEILGSSGSIEKIRTHSNSTVVKTRISNEIKSIRQLKKDDLNDTKIEIDFEVPNPLLYKPGLGSKYIAQKWDDLTNTWVNVGEKILEENDKKGYSLFAGNRYKITLDSTKVSHDDIVRIVSYESNDSAKNKDGQADFYDKKEKLEGCIEGFSKPNYSTRKEDGSPLVNEKPIYVSSKNEVEYVKIDLEGPNGNIKAVDEIFRRFINITGKFDEIPENSSATLEIGKEGDLNHQKIQIATQESIVNYVNRIKRIEDVLNIKISSKDNLGNEKTIDIAYSHENQCEIEVLDYGIRRKSINVKSNTKDIIITAIVYEKDTMTEIARGSVSIDKENELKSLELLKDGKPYRLKKNNRLKITGEGNNIKSNSMDIEIK